MQAIIETLKNTISSILDTITSFGGYLADLLWQLVENLKQAIIFIINWLGEISQEILIDTFTIIGNMIPDGWNSGIETALIWLGFIDCWIPISYGVQMLIAYYAMQTAMLPFKFVFRAIPKG